MIDRWRILVYLSVGFKIMYAIGDNENAKQMAYEQARLTLWRGGYFDDSRGIRTFYPARAVDKVKVIPPGIEIATTEVIIG